MGNLKSAAGDYSNGKTDAYLSASLYYTRKQQSRIVQFLFLKISIIFLLIFRIMSIESEIKIILEILIVIPLQKVNETFFILLK